MFPERLRELRKSRKLTAKAFGKKFSLAESTISGYETGARKPDIEQLEKFADFFEVSIDYLMGKTNERNHNKKSDTVVANNDELIAKIRNFANEIGMDPKDPKFLNLLNAAFDIVKRITKEQNN